MPYGTPAQLANLQPWWPGQQSPNPRGAHGGYRRIRILAETRKASAEAEQTAIKCMRDPEAPWQASREVCEMVLDRACDAPDQLLPTDRKNGAAGTSTLRIEIVDPDRQLSEIATIDTPPPPVPVGLVFDAPKRGDNK